MRKVYLDTASTTPIKKEVLEAMMPYFTDKWYNPNSIYFEAQQVREDVERSRETIANAIGAQNNEIFFTSGGSESNSWAIEGFVKIWTRRGYNPVVITTEVEHDSILLCVHDLECETAIVGVDPFGNVRIDSLMETVDFYSKNSSNKMLISIQRVNNETGKFQNIQLIKSALAGYEYVLHIDATQSYPWEYGEVVREADLVSISGHKIGAPKGIGILYKSKDVDISPIIYGTQNMYMRGGTENVPYIIGLGKAFELITKDRSIDEKWYRLRDAMRNSGIEFSINGRITSSKILNITLNHHVTANSIIQLLSVSGIQISAGSACNAHEEAPSHVLQAMGLTEEEAMRTIRISLPDDISNEEIDYFVDELKKAIAILSAEQNGGQDV